MNKEMIKEYIQRRTEAGLSTRPENIIRELKMKPEVIRDDLRELHLQREIYLDEMGWKAN